MSLLVRRRVVAGPAGALAAVESGTGDPAVVLVHGLAGTSSWWDATLAHLALDRRTVAYDLRGHGSSAAPVDARYDLAAHEADLSAVIESLNLARVVLVGHSFGATVVLHAAATFGPGRVAGVVLVDAPGDFSEAPSGAIEQFIAALQSEAYADLVADAFTENLVRATDETKRRVLAGVECTAPATMQGCYTALLRWRPGSALATWHGPLLLIGDAANESSFALHAQHPRRPVRLVRNASHWLQLDQPVEFQALLDDFLDTHGAPDASES